MDATTTFEAWALPNPVRDALQKSGIVTPTHIQSQSIDTALAGKDFIAHAISGTGKTLAFCLPLISLLDRDENRDKVGLVLAPTEGGVQEINDAIKKLTSKMTGRWKPVLVTEGTNVGQQEEGLRKRPRMIVATPDRLINHINSGIAKLDQVKFVVVDNADYFITAGQSELINTILDVIPNERQTMIFTGVPMQELNPITDKMNNHPTHLEGGEAFIPALSIPVEQQNNQDEELGRFDAVIKGLETHEGPIIALSRTKFRARKLAQRLNKAGFPTDCIHNERSNYQKQQIAELFNKNELRVVIITDTAIGDVEIAHTNHVVNFDIPSESTAPLFTEKASESGTLLWYTPVNDEEWLEMKQAILEAGKARIEEIKKQKALARENGELPERPRKKKPGKFPAKKFAKPQQQAHVDEDRQPNFGSDDDDDSQIFFQPSVEEQLNQLDSIIARKVRPSGGHQGNNNNGPRRKKQRPFNGNNRGGRGGGSNFNA